MPLVDFFLHINLNSGQRILKEHFSSTHFWKISNKAIIKQTNK